MDDDITAVQELPGVDDVSPDSSVEIEVRTPHGGHMRRHMLAATHTNAELRLVPPQCEDTEGGIERPVLTEEIQLEQALLDEQALLAASEREAVAARQLVLEACAADVRDVRVERRDQFDRVSRPRVRKPVLWPVPLMDDSEEDTAVDEVDWVRPALRGRR